MTLFWTIVGIIVIVFAAWYLIAGKKKGPKLPRRPGGPTPPPPPPETPAM